MCGHRVWLQAADLEQFESERLDLGSQNAVRRRVARLGAGGVALVIDGSGRDG
jgi:hypothetical protein